MIGFDARRFALLATLFTIDVQAVPGIFRQPTNQVIALGQTATFNVGATGAPPLTYQWLKENISIARGTNANLFIPNVQPDDAARYSVIVTEAGGASVTSPEATLTVYLPAAILEQPQSQNVLAGTSAEFSVVATGAPPPRYQWFANNNPISGATNDTLFFQNVSAAQPKIFWVRVWNFANSQDSDPATLTVVEPPVLTSQPKNRSVALGANVVFNVSAVGTEPLTYHWNFNGSPLASVATFSQSNLSLANVQASDAGNYQVIVSNAYGIALSDVAVLEIFRRPEITSHPQSQSAPIGGSITFSVAAQGDEPLAYQWYFRGGVLDGATGPTFTISSVQESDEGDYRVAVTNPHGSILSAPAVISLETPVAAPGISTQPQSQSADRGSTVGLWVSASGTSPFSYQWFFNGAPISGRTNSSLVLANAQMDNAGDYHVVVANAYGIATSEVAEVEVLMPQLPPLSFVDDFSNSVPIVGVSFVVGTGSNIGATLERPAEPMHEGVNSGHSVWLSWTAPSNGIVRLNTYGSDFDTIVSVYTNDTLATLGRVAGDDDTGNDVGANHSSEVSFNAVAGVTYHIVVAGHWFSAGNIVFHLRLDPSINRMPVFISDLPSFAVREGEDAFLNFEYSSAEPVQIDWLYEDALLPTNANSTFNRISSVSDSLVGRYRVRITTLTSTNYSHWGEIQINASGRSNVLARDKLGDAMNFGHYLDAVSVLTQADKKKPTGYSAAKFGSGAHGFSGTQIFSTTGATSDPQEPIHCSVGAGKSEWYAYQAETNGWLRIDTEGSSFNTVLAVYIGPGDTYSTLTNIACDDNSGSNGFTSKVVFQATQGTIYWIAVDGRSGASPQSGTVKLNYKLGEPVSIGAQPQSQTVPIGTNVAFFADANGMTNYTFQWRFFGTNLPGATGSNLTRINVTSMHAGPYDFVVRNPLGSATSSVAILTVAGTLSITQHPQNVVAVAGTNVSFAVGASGDGPLNYQWIFNGTNLPGATDRTLTLLNVQAIDGGSYAVNVTDAHGSLLSSNASLTVQLPPVITLQPASRTAALGSAVTLSAAATGVPAPAYQWFFNNTPIPGAAAPTLDIAEFQASNEGIYSMEASNVLGVAHTLDVELLANSPVRFTNVFSSNAMFGMRLIGAADTSYIIQWSTNNSDWVGHATNSSPNGIWNFTEQWTNWSMRTYRAHVAP